MTENADLEALRRLYEKSVADDPATDSTFEAADRLSEAEHQLQVDRALGLKFPPQRRLELLKIHQEMTCRRNDLIQRFISKQITSRDYIAGLQKITQDMARSYAAVLNPGEYEAFLGAVPDESVALPLDPALLKS